MATTLIAAYEELDEAIGERVRGEVGAAYDVLHSLEKRILATRADTQEVLAWKVRHLSRALKNDWEEEEATPIAHSIERDLAVMVG